MFVLNVTNMFQVFLKFRSSDNCLKECTSSILDSMRSCYKFIDEFPNVEYWSISPVKVLAPIQKKGQDFSVNINLFDRNQKRDVFNDIGIDGIQDFINNLDLDNVSEIKIRLNRWI